MMTFSYVDLNSITDTDYELFKSINEGFYPNNLTQIYVVKDNEDIKSVFCIEVSWPTTEVTFSAGTKESERNKGYFEFGFYMILEIIKSNPSIQKLIIYARHDATIKFCEKYGLPNYNDFSYYFENPNFNPKYNELRSLIDANTSLEDLIAFCEDDEIMLAILNYWLRFYDNDDKKLKIS